jgi:uncharacterized oxidoreductase
MELKNSTVLITGGTSGIGLEFVKQLTAQGANIIVTGRKLDKLKETKKQFPKISIFQSDVGNPKDIEQLYKSITQQFPELNIIINNALCVTFLCKTQVWIWKILHKKLK